MNISKVGNRGTLFTFEDDISIYLINTEKRLFLCDTHLGPISMEMIKQYIHEQGWQSKELIIFNSHSDWDHIWGNCAFENNMIIAHYLCKERMCERAQYDLDVLPIEFRKGTVTIKLPNLTFDKKLTFEEDGIEFIYAPGHTICSCICYDKIDSVVFSGDLIEKPMPFTSYENLTDFVNSLEFIKSLQAKIVITAHSGLADDDLLYENIKYIKSILSGSLLCFTDKGVQLMHENNLKRILILKHEKVIKQRLGDKFNYMEYKLNFWRFMKVQEEMLLQEYINIKNTSYVDLEKGLIAYLNLL